MADALGRSWGQEGGDEVADVEKEAVRKREHKLLACPTAKRSPEASANEKNTNECD